MPTFPTDINKLADPRQDSDGATTDVIMIPASAPYTHQLGQGAPLNLPTGWQIIPPSGVPGAVTVSGGGHGTWTEVTNGTSLSAGQFSVDYSASATTGGTVYFAAADAGMTSVSIQYTGALEVNKQWALDMTNAIRAVVSGRGAANGLAGLDANSRLLQLPATGVRQVVAAQVIGTSQIFNASVVSPTTFGATTLDITTTGGTIYLEYDLGLVHTGADTSAPLAFYGLWTGAASSNKLMNTINGLWIPNGARGAIHLSCVIAGLAAGLYHFSPAYTSGAITGWSTGDGSSIGWGRVTEFV